MTIIGLYLFTLAILIGLTMVYQASTGRRDLLCLRNVFLVGLVVFQITSVGLRMFSGDFHFFSLQSPGSAAGEFAFYVSLFVPFFFLAYRWGPASAWVTRKIPRMPESKNPAALFVLAIIMTLIAVPLRFSVNIPLIGILTNFVGVGTAAMACGLIGWIWAPRLFNPVYASLAVIFVSINLLTAMGGGFGRRDIIAVFGCLVWGMYYSHWRYIPFKALFTRLLALSIVPIIFVALFTSVRSAADKDRSASEHLSEIQTGGSIMGGLGLLIDGQGTGPASLWLIEHHPEDYEYRHLFTIRYAFLINVPRAFWTNKPWPMSVLLADMANIQGVQQDKITLSSGIIGVGAAEGGFYAIILYAVCLGVYLRLFEEIVQDQPLSPFIVLPVGAALGQILGLARGDTSSFASNYFITTAGALLLMIPIGRFMARFNLEADYTPEDYDDYTEDLDHFLDDPDQAT